MIVWAQLGQKSRGAHELKGRLMPEQYCFLAGENIAVDDLVRFFTHMQCTVLLVFNCQLLAI